MPLQDLPALNALLNSMSAVLLALGFLFIRAGRREAHRKCMLGAVACSTLFLTSYLYYHAHVGSVRFTRVGTIRTVYFSILVSHTALAMTIVPLVAFTLRRALQERYDLHRRVARVTLPLWGYVSITGVVVYWMLYRLQ